MKTVARWLVRGRGSGATIVQSAMTRGIMLALNLATSVVSARALGPADRGVLAAQTLWPQLFGFLFTLGLPIAMVYHIRKAPDDERELFTATALLTSLASVVAIVAGYVLLPTLLHRYGASDMSGARALLVFTLPTALLLIVTCRFDARGEYHRANRLRSLPPVVTLVALFGLVVTSAMTPMTAALAYLAPQALLLILSARELRDTFARPIESSRKCWRALLGYGLRFYMLDVITTLSAQVDRLLVVAFLDPASMGLYAVALNGSRILSVISWGTTQVVFPKAVSLGHEAAIEMTGTGARIVGSVTLVSALALVLVLPFVVRTLFGASFGGAIPVMQILLFEAAISGVVATLAQGFLAVGRPATMSALQGAGFAVAFGAMLILIPKLGIIGAAWALLGSTLARLLFVWCSFPLVLHTSPPSLVLGPADVNFVRRVARREFAGARAGDA